MRYVLQLKKKTRNLFMIPSGLFFSSLQGSVVLTTKLKEVYTSLQIGRFEVHLAQNSVPFPYKLSKYNL